jgi:glycosyltransferase involved in cell wall biosynthesis
MPNPLISVVIPTYNEEKDIPECLSSLAKQSYKNKEVIIVDDGSTDKTLEVIKKFKPRVIKGQHKGPGFSRNLGSKKAKGSILIFVDADMTFDKDYLKNLVLPIIKNRNRKEHFKHLE